MQDQDWNSDRQNQYQDDNPHHQEQDGEKYKNIVLRVSRDETVS